MATLKICKHSNGYGYCFLHEEYCSESPCEKEELIEYAPVVRGHWIVEPGKIPRCSECNEYSDDGYNGAMICPWCGARMEACHEV